MCGCAYANCSEVEVGSGLRENEDFSRGCNGLCAHSGCAGIGASHIHGAVRAAGILLVGSKARRTSPRIGSTVLSIDIQMNGLTNAIRSVIGDNTRKDAAVGFART